MNDATTFFINQQVRQYESQCMSAIGRVRNAATMPQVKQAAHVVAHPVLRSVRLNRVGAGRQLEQAAQLRMTQLLDEQLKRAAAEPDLDARKAYLGQLRVREWNSLRGDYPILYRRADTEGQKLIAKP